MAVISLTTDFGTRDEYVGVLKAVICGINPQALVIDITHHIAPHDVAGAAFMLKSTFTWFPIASIHVAVIDPGVGGTRAIVAARVAGHYLIAPDNGLLAPLIDEYGVDELIAVQTRAFFKQPLSRTFHGRDIFAPVAAHLSLGVAMRDFGPPIDRMQLTDLAWPRPHVDADGTLHGHVVGVDRFGNLITDIGYDHLKAAAHSGGGRGLRIHAGGRTIEGLISSYGQGPEGVPAAILGSRDCLEIAVNQGSAEKLLSIGKGAPVEVCPAARGTNSTGENA